MTPPDPVVCLCGHVTESRILLAVQEATGAAVGCGDCTDDILDLIHEVIDAERAEPRERAEPNAEPATTAERVRRFHEVFGLDHPPAPAVVAAALAEHRQVLLEEEVAELAEAVGQRELSRIAHKLADVVYTAYGTATVFGIDLDAVIAEVHRANMSKLGPAGLPALRADGKCLKGPGYRPPDVAGVLARQIPPTPGRPRPDQ